MVASTFACSVQMRAPNLEFVTRGDSLAEQTVEKELPGSNSLRPCGWRLNRRGNDVCFVEQWTFFCMLRSVAE